ncbi:MAG: acyltransferase [Spongiibacteraceae bacterium]
MTQVSSTESRSEQIIAATNERPKAPWVLRKYIPELDGLRAIAIILVVWHNVTAGEYIGGVVWKLVNLLSNTGWVGVQLFFVLSGFLITGILLDEKKSPHQLRNFYMRRVMRIFPLYYAVLGFAFVLLPLFHLTPLWLHDDLRQQLWYWTFLINWSAPILGDGHAFGHFWSLAVEEQFYLLWPLCVLTCQRRTLLKLGLFFIASALLIRSALIAYDLEFALAAAYKFTVARWDALAVGALLAVMVRDTEWSQLLLRYMRPAFVGAVAYIVIYAILNRNFAPVGPSFAALNQTVAALLFGVVLFASIQTHEQGSTRWQGFLLHPFMRLVGKYSYAIYIFHLPVNLIVVPWWSRTMMIESAPLNATCLALLVFSLSYLAAMISWALLEQPCLRLKRFFYN